MSEVRAYLAFVVAGGATILGMLGLWSVLGTDTYATVLTGAAGAEVAYRLTGGPFGRGG